MAYSPRRTFSFRWKDEVRAIYDELFCEHAETCSGCPLIRHRYGEQLAAKQERVRGAITPYPGLKNTAIESVLPAEPPAGYRIRAKLMVGASSGQDGALVPVIGLFARGQARGSRPRHRPDHTVVDIPGCRVLSPRLLDVTSRLRRLLAHPPEAAGGCLVPEAMGGQLSAIDLREVRGAPSLTSATSRDGAADAGVLLTLVVRSPPEPRPTELMSAAEAARAVCPDILGVAVNFRAAGAPQVLGATTRVLVGREIFRDEQGPTYHLATFGSFVQAHPGQAERIRRLISGELARLPGAPKLQLLDLYGGSGALSLSLARAGAHVTMVESFRPAAQCAAQAAVEQGISTFTVREGDAGRVIGDLVTRHARFDAILVNPPRRGLTPEVRKGVAALAPKVVVYVSCEPDTLARDLSHWAWLGYRARALHPVDMIPLTDQVETVAFVEPAALPALTVHYEDGDVCVVDKPAYLAPRAPPEHERLWWSLSEQESGLCVWFRMERAPEARRRLDRATAPRPAYVVLARGITAAKGSIGKSTHFERLARVNGHSLLRVTAESPRNSGFSRDLARIGHPVIGDRRFGHPPTNRHFEERYTLDRPFVHCVELTFQHPRTNAPVRVESELPAELDTVLRRLGLSRPSPERSGRW